MLFSNPIKWAKLAVGSWPRLLFALVGNGALMYGFGLACSDGPLTFDLSKIWIGVAVVLFQFMYQYALFRCVNDVRMTRSIDSPNGDGTKSRWE